MVQIAREFGLHVITTSSSKERADFCTSLGAHVSIVRSAESFVEVVKESTLGSGVDLLVDCIGGPTVNDNLQVLKIGGKYVLLASDVGAGKVDLQKIIDKRITLTGASLRSRESSFRQRLVAEVQDKVWPLVESKAIAPRIQKVCCTTYMYIEPSKHSAHSPPSLALERNLATRPFVVLPLFLSSTSCPRVPSSQVQTGRLARRAKRRKGTDCHERQDAHVLVRTGRVGAFPKFRRCSRCRRRPRPSSSSSKATSWARSSARSAVNFCAPTLRDD